MFKFFAAALLLSSVVLPATAAGEGAPEIAERTGIMSTSAGPVVQVALPTRDLEAAKTFYTEILGLPLLFETGGMAFFAAGPVRLMLGPPSSPEQTQSGGAVYFQPDDIAAAAGALAARGVAFLGEPQTVLRTEQGELQLRFFRDPDGNLLALMGEVAVR
ncbi:MAG: VOC family protein [Alphaproteobacteria bacterium]